ncbi:MAG: type III toxin-antitoxin system ToxN/AbiQ family toxin [Firmicutes bacterium]|nr:type III toxin-antitoxin system ToxN/AbiQ family toxin [Bacillota bacterium]
MKKNLMLVIIDKDYCNFLRSFDNRVPFNFNKKELRPFIGVLFEVNKCLYFAPLSSPKAKHLKLKNNIDFLKIDEGKLGAINFNNMIPVTLKNIEKLDLNINESLNKDEFSYKKLLIEQYFWLNRNFKKLSEKSQLLYNKYNDNTLLKNVRDRCCNFKLLEEKCLEYNN